VGKSENMPAIARFFQTNPVVVVVLHGESQDDAWHRYLTANPAGAGAHVKIFHYPEPVARKNNNSDVLQWRRRENRV
jgi:hypothetical protein